MSPHEPAPKKSPPAPAAPQSDEVDEASQESFPASDPPSWEPLHTGKPSPEPGKPDAPRPSDR